jgi:hypothetical protein
MNIIENMIQNALKGNKRTYYKLLKLASAFENMGDGESITGTYIRNVLSGSNNLKVDNVN